MKKIGVCKGCLFFVDYGNRMVDKRKLKDGRTEKQDV